jgi:hypothetical protein
MTDYLDNLTARTLNPAGSIRPMSASLFEPTHGISEQSYQHQISEESPSPSEIELLLDEEPSLYDGSGIRSNGDQGTKSFDSSHKSTDAKSWPALSHEESPSLPVSAKVGRMPIQGRRSPIQESSSEVFQHESSSKGDLAYGDGQSYLNSQSASDRREYSIDDALQPSTPDLSEKNTSKEFDQYSASLKNQMDETIDHKFAEDKVPCNMGHEDLGLDMKFETDKGKNGPAIKGLASLGPFDPDPKPIVYSSTKANSRTDQRHGTETKTETNRRVQVTIGRIEVRAIMPSGQKSQPKPAMPRISLDDYLKGRR